MKRVGANSLYTGGSNLIFVDTPEEGRISDHKDNGRSQTEPGCPSPSPPSGSSCTATGLVPLLDPPPAPTLSASYPTWCPASRCHCLLHPSPTAPCPRCTILPGGLAFCPYSFYTLSVPSGMVELTRWKYQLVTSLLHCPLLCRLDLPQSVFTPDPDGENENFLALR